MDTTTTAPLQNFTILGVVTKTYQAVPGAPVQPAGSCWHCGEGIMNCVVVRNLETGEVVDIGTTCAERVGLDRAELKAYLADKFAAVRAERAAANAAARRRAAEEREAELAGTIGPHGTESRYEWGCRCEPCRDAAPHGSLHRLYADSCVCPACMDALHAADMDGLVPAHRPVLIEVATGERTDARRVETQYGMSWVLDTPGGTVWVGSRPKRRTTQAKKGYVEAMEPWLVRRGQRGDFPVLRVGDAIADHWGEPIVRP